MQRDSTKLHAVEPEQLALIPQRRPSRPVSLEHIPVLKDTADAIDYACKLAGVVPKEIFPHMGKEKTAWSRILSGEFDIPGRDIPKFNRAVGNSAYLLYVNHMDGWDLTRMHKVQDDKDKRIAELEKQLADQERAIQLMVQWQRK